MAEVAARLPDGPAYATMRVLTRPLGAEPHPPADRRDPDGHAGFAGFAERILAGTRAHLFADRSGALEIAAACVQDCRDQDVVGWLHVSLHLLALAQLSAGRYEDAAAAATEGLTVAEHDGRDHRATYLRAALATAAALTGAEDQCRSFAGTALDHARAHGIESAAAQARRALALLDLGSGHAHGALEHLQAALERVSHPLLSVFLLPDLVEAAVRTGQRDRAEEPVAVVERWAAVAGTPDAAALAFRCRALAAPDEKAEQHFTDALREHDAGADPLEQARTELLYGEWLRRARRRSDARRHLRAALETFERLGARPWANRTRAELQASGESLDQTAACGALLGRLSPQEREVVRLAATGATNREIASQLFLSPRTVGHHLYRAFPKLGISSRTELSQIFE
jgi:DNA-binding CsgD family transcriptional regulator